MNRDLIVNLLKEVNSKAKNKTISEMLLNEANFALGQNKPEAEVFASVLNSVKGLNETLKNDELTEVVEKYSKFESTPVVTLEKMMRNCGLTESINKIKATSIYSDAIIATTVNQITEAIRKFPEFRLIPGFIEALKPFSYDATIKEAIDSAATFLQKNATKLTVLNSIYELSLVPTNMYKNIVSILEQSLLDNTYTVDALKMKLREQIEIPVIKSLINDLTLVEAKVNKVFSLGVGAGATIVESVITPTTKLKDSVIALLNGKLVSIKESEAKVMEDGDVTAEEKEELKEFLSFCTAFNALGFKSTNEGVKAKLKNIEIELKNEGQELALYINKNKVKDPKAIDYGGIFVMESGNDRKAVSAVLNNIHFVSSLDFIKKVVTESKACHIIKLPTNTFVLENFTLTKVGATKLHSFLNESYGYNIGLVMEAEIAEEEKEVDDIENKKKEILENIEKLEASMKTLDESLTKNLDSEDSQRVEDLRFVLEKKINSLKDSYIVLEQKKTEKLNESQIIKTSKTYSINEEVKLVDGRSGKIVGVDTAANTYMVKLEDNQIKPMSGRDIQ